ncbi:MULTISPECIES: glucose-1-phosphate cytidylyltransferase [unclassified Methanoregula]|uniref:glucose-1-phosphate cytidylyltransferase n=1 Tax=unclassified Methanoregula TaxID=2649730 RepID=UPI0009C760C4|nr:MULTISPECIES: glucose-1-phosphate cytidylyltransferase [unclassified Methanoregula]OPX63689.1 MAG: Bifunctional protein GlmU [Methanoregula sp. PtaB.Bin085]OPY36144.1 MAG: Bifunctional protein GlmU [Methanoregula sp. PtaU1.Bin006]
MKVVILAGGLGTRLSEETTIRPKPMVEIGGKPILWHIMKIYSHYGFNEFVICLGYKGYMIKEYFANYFLHMSDVTIDIRKNEIETHQSYSEPWKISLIDTGDTTMTGGRIRRIRNYLNDETFMLTYGDGVSNVDISRLLKFHKKQKKTGTLTAIRPPGRFGALQIENDTRIVSFHEKPLGDGGYINGGFFVFEPELFEYLKEDTTVLEREPLEMLAKSGQLNAYKHNDFWYAMDTLRDKNYLEQEWASGRAPWKVWD